MDRQGRTNNLYIHDMDGWMEHQKGEMAERREKRKEKELVTIQDHTRLGHERE